MTKVYLGGPMRGYKDFNFPAFLEAADQLRAKDYWVLSPAEYEISLGYDGRGYDGDPAEFTKKTGFNLRKALRKDLEYVCSAEMVIVLPGWEKSTGTRAEVATAVALGLPVVPLDKALIKNPPYREHHLIIDKWNMPLRDFQAITDVDKHLDENCGKRYKAEPLGQDWARVSKAAEEVGEAIKAYINYTGQNPRKGECGTLDDVLNELADTAFSAIFAIQHFTKDAEVTAEVLDRNLQKAVGRVNQLANGSKK